jgi:hypothetical protein
MATYTLHVPEGSIPGEAGALERAELVRDGFSPGAFLFTFLWCAANRLWLASLGVLAAFVGLTSLLIALRVSPGAAFLAELLLALLVGLEASSLKRWTFARQGRPAVDVVEAEGAEEAELKTFRRWLAGRAEARRGPAAPMARRPPEPVIGLFPEAERPR